MPLKLTKEQIVQLAPDEASVKAAKGLATTSKWGVRQFSDRCIWGHCQGSGKNPYQTAVDITDIAFKCSCPSRKFPCKHALGLLFLYESHADGFEQADEPDWVKAWLDKRAVRAEKKEKPGTQAAPVDEEAKAKRLAKRHQNVMEGMADLEVWMKDLLRNGLVNVPERAYSVFEAMAKRMVDAQAPGLAARLRAMADIDYGAESWKHELTDKLSKLFMVISAYRNVDRLPADWQDEIRTQVGFSQSRDMVLGGEPLVDRWLVLGKRSQTANGLTTDSYWFYGEHSGRCALYLSFSVPGSIADAGWVPGCVYDGSMCYYPGAGTNRRALPKELILVDGRVVPAFCADLSQAALRYRQHATENPLAEDIPLLVSDVLLAGSGGACCLVDMAGNAVPLVVSDEMRIDVLAISGGKPFSAFVLANDGRWRLVAMWYNNEYHTWRDEHN